MADSDKNTVEEKLAALRESYFSSLPDKVSHIQELWASVQKDPIPSGKLKELQHATHTLAGSGATLART